MIKIGEVFNIEKGILQSSKCTPGQYDFVTASEEWKTHITYSHECEALIFAMAASGSLGRTHYVNGKFITSDLCFILTPKEEYFDRINLKFYFYYFNTFREKIVKATATGTSKLAINRKIFSNYKIHYIDIDMQNKLIPIIESTQLLTDKLQNDISEQKRYVEYLRQSILQQAVEGKLCEQTPNEEPASILLEKIKKEKDKLVEEGKIKKQKELPLVSPEEKPFKLPDGWEWCRFGDIANIASNLVAPEKYLDYMHIAPDNIEKNTAHLLPCSTVKDNSVKSFNHLFSKGQIIYSKIRPALRKVVLAPFEGLCSADMYPIDALCVPKYLLYYMLTDCFTVQVTMNDNRVKMPKTNQNELLKVLVAIPPLQEQRRIVEKVDELMILCHKLENEVNKAQQYAAQLMESVLQEAFLTDEQAVEEQLKYKGKVIPIRPEQKAELHLLWLQEEI